MKLQPLQSAASHALFTAVIPNANDNLIRTPRCTQTYKYAKNYSESRP